LRKAGTYPSYFLLANIVILMGVKKALKDNILCFFHTLKTIFGKRFASPGGFYEKILITTRFTFSCFLHKACGRPATATYYYACPSCQ
jgi:hypothetical protein